MLRSTMPVPVPVVDVELALRRNDRWEREERKGLEAQRRRGSIAKERKKMLLLGMK